VLSKKAVQDAVQVCLDGYVRIYYFFPLLQERTVKGVKLDREVYAVLWMCATLIKENGDDYCLQLDVHRVFRWWNPDYTARASNREKSDTHLTKLLNLLENAGYVTKTVHLPNKRTREIRITPKGSKLLEDINRHRESSIRSLFKLVRTKEQLRLVSDSVEAIAHFTWKTMNTQKAYDAQSTLANPREAAAKPKGRRRS
jgi:DNA-binding PadR family transcriptional regulator